MIGDTIAETLAAQVHVLPVKMEVREMDELREMVATALRR